MGAREKALLARATRGADSRREYGRDRTGLPGLHELPRLHTEAVTGGGRPEPDLYVWRLREGDDARRWTAVTEDNVRAVLRARRERDVATKTKAKPGKKKAAAAKAASTLSPAMRLALRHATYTMRAPGAMPKAGRGETCALRLPGAAPRLWVLRGLEPGWETVTDNNVRDVLRAPGGDAAWDLAQLDAGRVTRAFLAAEMQLARAAGRCGTLPPVGACADGTLWVDEDDVPSVAGYDVQRPDAGDSRWWLTVASGDYSDVFRADGSMWGPKDPGYRAGAPAAPAAPAFPPNLSPWPTPEFVRAELARARADYPRSAATRSSSLPEGTTGDYGGKLLVVAQGEWRACDAGLMGPEFSDGSHYGPGNLGPGGVAAPRAGRAAQVVNLDADHPEVAAFVAEKQAEDAAASGEPPGVTAEFVAAEIRAARGAGRTCEPGYAYTAPVTPAEGTTSVGSTGILYVAAPISREGRVVGWHMVTPGAKIRLSDGSYYGPGNTAPHTLTDAFVAAQTAAARREGRCHGGAHSRDAARFEGDDFVSSGGMLHVWMPLGGMLTPDGFAWVRVVPGTRLRFSDGSYYGPGNLAPRRALQATTATPQETPAMPAIPAALAPETTPALAPPPAVSAPAGPDAITPAFIAAEKRRARARVWPRLPPPAADRPAHAYPEGTTFVTPQDQLVVAARSPLEPEARWHTVHEGAAIEMSDGHAYGALHRWTRWSYCTCGPDARLTWRDPPPDAPDPCAGWSCHACGSTYTDRDRLAFVRATEPHVAEDVVAASGARLARPDAVTAAFVEHCCRNVSLDVSQERGTLTAISKEGRVCHEGDRTDVVYVSVFDRARDTMYWRRVVPGDVVALSDGTAWGPRNHESRAPTRGADVSAAFVEAQKAAARAAGMAGGSGRSSPEPRALPEGTPWAGESGTLYVVIGRGATAAWAGVYPGVVDLRFSDGTRYGEATPVPAYVAAERADADALVAKYLARATRAVDITAGAPPAGELRAGETLAVATPDGVRLWLVTVGGPWKSASTEEISAGNVRRYLDRLDAAPARETPAEMLARFQARATWDVADYAARPGYIAAGETLWARYENSSGRLYLARKAGEWGDTDAVRVTADNVAALAAKLEKAPARATPDELVARYGARATHTWDVSARGAPPSETYAAGDTVLARTSRAAYLHIVDRPAAWSTIMATPVTAGNVLALRARLENAPAPAPAAEPAAARDRYVADATHRFDTGGAPPAWLTAGDTVAEHTRTGGVDLALVLATGTWESCDIKIVDATDLRDPAVVRRLDAAPLPAARRDPRPVDAAFVAAQAASSELAPPWVLPAPAREGARVRHNGVLHVALPRLLDERTPVLPVELFWCPVVAGTRHVFTDGTLYGPDQLAPKHPHVVAAPATTAPPAPSRDPAPTETAMAQDPAPSKITDAHVKAALAALPQDRRYDMTPNPSKFREGDHIAVRDAHLYVAARHPNSMLPGLAWAQVSEASAITFSDGTRYTPTHTRPDGVFPAPSRPAALLAVLRVDADAALVRTTGRQLVKAARDPLAALCARHLGPDDAALRGRVAAFLATPAGYAAVAALLAGAFAALPTEHELAGRLGRELRISAMAEAGDALASLVTGPLLAAVAAVLRDVPEAAESVVESTGVRVDAAEAADTLPAGDPLDDLDLDAVLSATRSPVVLQ